MKTLLKSAAIAAATVFAVLPASAQGINVKIVAGKDKASSSVTASGTILHVITDQERTNFGIGDSPLKNAVNAYFGKKPNDVYVKSPTPWDDLYKTYSWPQVTTNLTVVDAKVMEITSEPIILAKKTLRNNSNVPATFTADVSDSVSNTATSSWNASVTAGFSQTISYEVGIEGIAKVGGSSTFSFSGTYGQGGSHSSSTTVSSGQAVSVKLDPGQAVVANLNASRGTMKVRVTYDVHLEGDVAVNYNPTFKGHHFWALGIGGVMQAAGKPNTFTVTEDISVGYYSNGEVTLTNLDGTAFSG